MFIGHCLLLVDRFECLGIKCWFNILGYGMLGFGVIKDLKRKDVILRPGDHGVSSNEGSCLFFKEDLG